MKILIVAITLTVALFIVPAAVNAQNISTISGKVVNGANEPLLGNVVLLAVPDSGFIKGAGFTNGAFEVPAVNLKEVFLKLTSLQFPDTVIKVQYNGQQHVDLGTIVIRQSKFRLNEVRVTSQAPLVRYANNGNIEVNVANTVLASSASVSEILTRTPNVIENDGRYSVFGKGEAIIYLNGKLITSERLASIPSSQIAKIEIISNPSSKYDAEGKAVINIITKVKVDEGIMGTISQYLTWSDFAGSNANTFADLSYMKGKFSLVGNYAILFGKTREVLHTIRTRPTTDDYMNSDLRTDWNSKLKNFSTFGLGAQYNINEKSNISLAYNGYLEDLGGTQDSRNTIITTADNSFYTSGIAKKDVLWNHSVTLNYNRTLDTLGSAFFIGSQFSHYDDEIDDFIDEKNIVNGQHGGRFLKNNVDHSIDISSTQADLTKYFDASNKLEAGAKFSYVNNTSGTDFLVAENGGDYKPDTQLSNSFKYIEKVPAIYVNYSGAIGAKTNYGFGVRGEWTNYELNTSVGGGQLISDNYFNIFPNVSISTAVSDKLRLRASYVSRITRPRYQSLNPLVVYQDPFTTIEGNPNLIPEKTHSFEAGANYRQFDFRVGYNYVLDPLDAAALRGTTPNSYVLKAINLDKGYIYYAALSKSFNLKWWTSTNTANLSYNKLTDTRYNFVMVDPKPQIYLYSSNTFTVGNLFKLQLLAWFLGDKAYGLYYDNSRSTVTLGIEKDVLKGLKLKFMANDIFHGTNASGTYGVGQTDIYYNRTYNTNYFRLIATYSFGRLTKTNYKSKATGQSENNRAN